MEFDVKKVMTKRNYVTAIGAIAALFILSACSNPGNAAATVGKTSVSINKLQSTVSEILSERSKISNPSASLETGETLNRSQVTFFVISELLFQIGKTNKISVTEQEITDQIKAVTEQVGGEASLPAAMVNAGIAPQNLREYFRSYLYSAKISRALLSAGFTKDNVNAAVQKLVADEAKKLKVSINPRYGSWDASAATITAAPLAAGSVKK